MRRPPRDKARSSVTATEPLTVLMTRDAFAELWETLRYAGDLEYAGGPHGPVRL